MKNIIYMILTAMLWCALSACSRKPTIENGHLQAVEAQASASTLYYTGTIQPLNTVVITCPADGVVVDMPFQYGESVKSGQRLFELSSTKFLSDYKTALMQYVKAKSEFNTGQTQMSEASFLHKNELISDDDFKTKQASFYASQLSLLQAKDTLDNLLHQLNVKDINLYNLSITDIDKVTQALHLQQSSQDLLTMAPASGVVLSPNKNDDSTKKITKGDVVKQGDVMAIIGDMSGVQVNVSVNELEVNKLKVGQTVKITGIAFPDQVLEGTIQQVDRQGEMLSGGQPSFSVAVVVPKLTPEQQNEIHVGMSAKVEININDQPHIMIPITAVAEKNNQPFVQKYDEKKNKLRMVAVKTGETTIDSVAILTGLKSGDQIVVPN